MQVPGLDGGADLRTHWISRILRLARESSNRTMYDLLDACFLQVPLYGDKEPWVGRPTQRGPRTVGGVRRWEPDHGGDVIRYVVFWPKTGERTVERIETQRFVDRLGELWHQASLNEREQAECRDMILKWCSIDERDGHDTAEAQSAHLTDTIKLRQKFS